MSDSGRTVDAYRGDLVRCALDWAGSTTWAVPDGLRDRLRQFAETLAAQGEALTQAQADVMLGAKMLARQCDLARQAEAEAAGLRTALAIAKQVRALSDSEDAILRNFDAEVEKVRAEQAGLHAQVQALRDRWQENGRVMDTAHRSGADEKYRHRSQMYTACAKELDALLSSVSQISKEPQDAV